MSDQNANPSGGAAGSATHVKFTHRPDLGLLVSEDQVARYAAEQELEIEKNKGALGALAFGRVAALQFNFDVITEAAFARIAELETQLAKMQACLAPAIGGKK
jgi:hypothetical protein